MLIDDVKITVQAGNGGNGSSVLRRDGMTARGGPDGGNGGNGGSIYVTGVNDYTALTQFSYKKTIKAENGGHGTRQGKHGKAADDLYIAVPAGTRITDLDNGTVSEVQQSGKTLLLARGGKGGLGNKAIKFLNLRTAYPTSEGEPGEFKNIRLVLKLIADIGLIGKPNGGKSSLLKELTNADPKIGNYPFTTLEPNIGMMNDICIADIPGLIEGASTGKGLGIKFLKHIERTRLLVHCIDATEENPLDAYSIIRQEFETYNPELLNKKELIVLTKTDLTDKKTLDSKQKQLASLNKDILMTSVYDKESIEGLKKKLLEENSAA